MLKNWVTRQADRLVFGFRYKLVDVEVIAHRGANPIVEGESGLPAATDVGYEIAHLSAAVGIVLSANLPGNGHARLSESL